MGYTPAFSTMYDGTLHGKWPTAAVWASLLPLLDVSGELNLTYDAISARTGWPMDLLREGIAALMEPDPDSKSRAEDGRRLVLLDPARTWGWRAVNHSTYREKARKQNSDRWRAESGANADRMRDRRVCPEAGAGHTRPAPTRAEPLSDSDSDSDTDTNKEKNIYARADASAESKEAERSPRNEPAESERTPKRKRARTDRAARPLEPEELGEFRFSYPPRAGAQPWRRAIASIRTRLHEGDSWPDIIAGAKRYRLFCEATGKLGTEYVMQVATFVGPERHYMQPWTLPTVPAAKETPEQSALRRLTERRAAIGLAGFRAPLANETSTAYRTAQDDEWHRRKDAKARNGAPVPKSATLAASIMTAAELAAALRPMPPETNEPTPRRGRD